MNRIPFILIAVLLFLSSSVTAQVRVALIDFQNETDRFHLDSWERLVPDLLREDMSSFEEIVIVTRDRLESIMQEQALYLSGMVDPQKAREFGKLLEAEFIITGTILSLKRDIRISAEIIRIKTGQIVTESVTAPASDHIETMINMLSNNLRYSLTGQGKYLDKIQLKSDLFWYYLGSTVLLGSGALYSYRNYQDNWDLYLETESLRKYDKYYDEADRYRKWSIVLSSLTAAAFTGTVVSWINNLDAQEIYARPAGGLSLKPVFYYVQKDCYEIGIVLRF